MKGKATSAQLRALAKARAAKKKLEKRHHTRGVSGVEDVAGIDGHKRRRRSHTSGVGSLMGIKMSGKDVMSELKNAGLTAVGVLGSRMIEKKFFTDQAGLMGWIPTILQVGGGILLTNQKNQVVKMIGRGVLANGMITGVSKVMKKDLMSDQVLQGITLENIFDGQVNGIGAFDAIEQIKLPKEYRAELPLLGEEDVDGIDDEDVDGIDDVDGIEDDDFDGLDGRGRRQRKQRKQARRGARKERRMQKRNPNPLPNCNCEQSEEQQAEPQEFAEKTLVEEITGPYEEIDGPEMFS